MSALKFPISAARPLFVIPSTAVSPRPASDRAVSAARSRRQGHAQEDLLEQRGVCPPEEALGGGRAVDVEVVHGRERSELAIAQACAPRHEPMLRPGLERPGSVALALGLK